MPGKVELGAIGGGAVDAVTGEVQVGRELADVHAQRPKAHVQGIGAGRFEHLRDLQVLFDGGHEGAVAERLVVLFDAVDEHLHREIAPARFLDALDHLADETRAVLERLRAVLVVAVVAHAREERLPEVVAGRVDLDGVEPLVLERLGGRNGIGHDQAYLFARQISRHGRGELPRRVLLRAAERNAHAGYLIAHVGALFVDGVGDALEGDLVHGLGARIGEMLVFVGAVLHPHQVDPALREAAVIGDDLVFVALGVGARSRFHHAVRQFERAYLDTREQGDEIGGVSSVVVALRIELRWSLPDFDGPIRLGCTRRSFLLRSRPSLRSASGQHPSRQKTACGSCGGSGQKAPSRQVGSCIGHVSPSFLACLPSFSVRCRGPGASRTTIGRKAGPRHGPKVRFCAAEGRPKG